MTHAPTIPTHAALPAALLDRVYAGFAGATVFRDLRRRAFGDEALPNINPFSFVTRTDVLTIASVLIAAGSARFVDLGCGNGDVTRLIAQHAGCDAIGVDLSGVAITEAAAANVGDRCEFLSCSYADVPWPRLHIDAIVSVDALLPVVRPDFRSIGQGLDPGRPLVFTTWTRRNDDGSYAIAGTVTLAGYQVLSVVDTDPGLARQKRFYRGVLAEHIRVRDELGIDAYRVLLAEAEHAFEDERRSTRVIVHAIKTSA